MICVNDYNNIRVSAELLENQVPDLVIPEAGKVNQSLHHVKYN